MSIARSAAVGVEMTGSRAAVALVDQCGRVLQRREVKTLRGRPVTATLEPYLRAVDAMFTHAHEEQVVVCGIGVSLPGSLDYTRRRPSLVPTLPALNGFPLCELLEARFQVPTHLLVDVDAALLGEHYYGAGRGFSRLFYLTVNAVVGAALLIDGQLERPEGSAQFAMGHVCHLSIATNGPRCSCGKRGCISTLVSLDAMQKMVQRALRRGDESSLTQRLLNREHFSPLLLAEEAARGDTVALQIYHELGRWLSAAVAQYVSLCEPNILILGGDVLCTSDVLLSRVRSAVGIASTSRVCSMIEVATASLGNNAVLIGAAAPSLKGATYI